MRPTAKHTKLAGWLLSRGKGTGLGRAAKTKKRRGADVRRRRRIEADAPRLIVAAPGPAVPDVAELHGFGPLVGPAPRVAAGGNGDGVAALDAPRLKVRVGYVAGGTTDEPFTFSLGRMLQYEGNKAPRDRVVAGLNRACGLYVDRNREEMARGFLKTTDADVLLSIDSDIEFHEAMPEHVSEILAANPHIGVLAVNVPLGCNPTAGYFWSDEEGAWKPYLRLDPVPLMEVGGVATAICAIRRTVLEAVARGVARARREQRKALRDGTGVDASLHRWFSIFRPFDVFGDDDEADDVDERGVWTGEDLAFCWRVRELGHRIFILRYPYPTFHWKRQPLHDGFEGIVPAATPAQKGGPTDAAI